MTFRKKVYITLIFIGIVGYFVLCYFQGIFTEDFWNKSPDLATPLQSILVTITFSIIVVSAYFISNSLSGIFKWIHKQLGKIED